MSKSTFVTLAKGKRKYKLYSADILNVHKLISKKRPHLPKYENITSDELERTSVKISIQSWQYDLIYFLK